MDGFFGEMMSKIKSLRTCPAFKDNFQMKEGEREHSKLFKHLKNTPVVKEKLKYIERLDDEIKETISVYKAERADRLRVQEEMCNEICKKNQFPERDTQMFLELCHFEVDGTNLNHEKHLGVASEVNTTELKTKNTIGEFIKRNIELARRGSMASCSLTDEEKVKLEQLLLDETEDFNTFEDDTNKKPYRISLEDVSEDENYVSNAFCMFEDDMRRLDTINFELEKFTLDETEKEKLERKDSSKKIQVDWKDTVLMEQRLKTINVKLDELHVEESEESVQEIYMTALGSDSDLTETYND